MQNLTKNTTILIISIALIVGAVASFAIYRFTEDEEQKTVQTEQVEDSSDQQSSSDSNQGQDSSSAEQQSNEQQSQNESNEQQQSQEQSEQQSEQQSQPGIKIYTNSRYSDLRFEYPEDWIVTETFSQNHNSEEDSVYEETDIQLAKGNVVLKYEIRTSFIPAISPGVSQLDSTKVEDLRRGIQSPENYPSLAFLAGLPAHIDYYDTYIDYQYFLCDLDNLVTGEMITTPPLYDRPESAFNCFPPTLYPESVNHSLIFENEWDELQTIIHIYRVENGVADQEIITEANDIVRSMTLLRVQTG